MAQKTGASSVIVLKLGSTFGTAVAGGTGDKIEVESLTHGENAEELRVNPIGSGNDMDSESERGSTAPTVQFEKVCGYDDAGVMAISNFFGTVTSAVQGAAQCHSFLYNATRFEKFITAAFHGHSSGVYEYVSCAPRSLDIRAENPKDYVRMTMEMLADQQVLDSSTNTTGTLASATLANTKRVVVKPQDEFLINVQGGGALASPTDRVAITSFQVQYAYEMQHAREIRGVAGNSIPVSTGSPPFTCTVTITLRNQQDFTWFTAAQAGTEYKARLQITGDIISGSIRYQKTLWFPRLKLIADPKYDLTSAAENPLTVTFKALVASANPTGMISTYPFITYTNTKTASYATAA